MVDRYFVQENYRKYFVEDRNMQLSPPAAECSDPMVAQRIVDLLNADERLKDQTKTKLTAVK